MSINSIQGNEITQFEYGFLNGDKVMWPSWGAALGVVMEYCHDAGLGEFGKPTDKGREAMRDFESTLETT